MVAAVIVGVSLILVCFSVVIVFGAPYLPTLTPQVEAALDLLALQPGQTMLELGCGDGKVLLAAAKRGYRCVGYELNPLLVLVAWLRTRRYGKQVRVIWGNIWTHQWPEAQGVFAFILPRFMARLDKKITQQTSKPVKLVSFAFKIPHKQPQVTKNGVFLYVYK